MHYEYFTKEGSMSQESGSLVLGDIAITGVEELQQLAEQRGHGKTTKGTGIGAGVGAMLGSFGGIWLAVGLGALGALVGYSIGSELDQGSNSI